MLAPSSSRFQSISFHKCYRYSLSFSLFLPYSLRGCCCSTRDVIPASTSRRPISDSTNEASVLRRCCRSKHQNSSSLFIELSTKLDSDRCNDRTCSFGASGCPTMSDCREPRVARTSRTCYPMRRDMHGPKFREALPEENTREIVRRFSWCDVVRRSDGPRT